MARILIVDDEPAIQVTIRLLLERAGHNVVTAGDGRNGLAIFAAEAFDLLFLDIFMPGMDGLETMRRVRQQRPLIPIIVISGHLMPSDSRSGPDFLNMATRLGAIRSLQKPFKPAELLAAVATCLEIAKQTVEQNRRANCRAVAGGFRDRGRHGLMTAQEARDAVSTIRMRSAAFLAPSFFMILAR